MHSKIRAYTSINSNIDNIIKQAYVIGILFANYFLFIYFMLLIFSIFNQDHIIEDHADR